MLARQSPAYLAARVPGLEGRFSRKHLDSRDLGVLIDGEVRELRQWDGVRVAPDVVRAFASGPGGLELIAVGGP